MHARHAADPAPSTRARRPRLLILATVLAAVTGLGSAIALAGLPDDVTVVGQGTPAAPGTASAPSTGHSSTASPPSSRPAPRRSDSTLFPGRPRQPEPTMPGDRPTGPGGSGGSGGDGPASNVSCVDDQRGIPRKGAYVGAAVSGTSSLPDVEQRMGRTLPIHRSYFLAEQVYQAIDTVRADLAAKRLPWISFKLPYSWAEMAAGRGDAWARDIVARLATVGGPVWLAFHHEPEGDGNMQDWKRMQQHLAPIVHAGARNVAYTVILIGWNSFFGPADQRIDDTFPGSEYVDVLGIDVYNGYGAKPHFTRSLDPMRYFGVIGPWARRHGVEWAVAETGYTARAASVDPDWLQTAYRDLKDQGGIALTYFDSSQNSIADWTLDDQRRAAAFDALVLRSRRLC